MVEMTRRSLFFFYFESRCQRLFTAASPVELYVAWGNRWPEAPFIRHLVLGNQETLLINTPEAHKEVFQTHCYDFVKPEFLFRVAGEVVGRGLLFSEGAEHKRQRRLLTGVFSVPSLKRSLPLFQDKAGALTGLLQTCLDAEGRGFIEAVETFSKATIDVVGVTLLGVELNHLTSVDKKMENFLKSYHRALEQPPLGALISFINGYVSIRRFLPIEANLGFIQANREIRKMMRACIHQRMQELEEATRNKAVYASAYSTVSGGRDILTMMLEDRKTFKGTDDELTIDEITEQLLTFMAAGHETTAGMLTWASFVMATRPDVQDKLRDEMTVLLKDTPNPGYNDIERLHYLNNFSRELLRVYCPAILVCREAAKDLTICGQIIPKGTPLLAVPAVSSLPQASWGPDANEFKPERWDKLQGLAAAAAASPYAYGAFSHGPRVCIGKQYALTEFKVLLLEMLPKFRFGTSPQIEGLGPGGMPPLLNPTLTFRPKGGLMVGVERVQERVRAG
ncbi:cytochrome P450 [Bombardia bombarda]|uniref:Cytochrome P450 n=1 Tax=Bombardia bombarda TaxID=252184 RepID=A0AA40CGS6_9PEZI|nr:cytochrome P450 [Bombardia bombarda]